MNQQIGAFSCVLLTEPCFEDVGMFHTIFSTFRKFHEVSILSFFEKKIRAAIKINFVVIKNGKRVAFV